MIVEVDKELEEIFPRYLKNRADDMLKLQTAVDAKDFETLRHIGHKMAGNAAGYGLFDLAEFARTLEQAASREHSESCQDLIQKMKGYLADLTLKFV